MNKRIILLEIVLIFGVINVFDFFWGNLFGIIVDGEVYVGFCDVDFLRV